jgi:fatty-acyl-CoA synthase
MSPNKTSPHSAPSYWPADRSEPVLEQTIGDALRGAVATWGERTALVEGTPDADPCRRWSFASLLEDSEQVARALLGRFSPGEHVAIWAANSPEWVLIEFGAALAGITLVTVNPAYLAEELKYVLTRSKAVGLIVQPEYRGRNLLSAVEEVRPGLPLLRDIIPLSSWSGLIASGSPTQRLPQVTPGDIAQIQYTSGTTGFSKGALLSHRSLSNNGRFYARAIGATPDDVWINPMPMFHTAGCGLLTLGALQTGGTHVLPSGFDPAVMLSLFESERGTIMLSVPTMLIRMLDHPDVATRNLSSWRLATLGGAPVPPELVRRARELVGMKLAIGFGQTEASPYITHTLPDDPHPDWISTVGRPLPQTEVKVVDHTTGETVPIGTVGELCARGYGLMAGYFDDPAATALALDADGWLHTSDLGSMDSQGYCSVQGRLRDMIIRGGENIYPREIEDVLVTHPALADASVVGIADQEWGEVVAAFVQLKPGYQATGEDLKAFCHQHLASYKVPRHWRFVEKFPLTASGKIQKFVLRDRFQALPE